MMEMEVLNHHLSQTKMLMDRFRSHLPDRSSRMLGTVFGMLRTFGGAPSDATSLNIDHVNRSLVAFFKIPFASREIEEIFKTLNRNGCGQLHVQDFILGLQVNNFLSKLLALVCLLSQFISFCLTIHAVFLQGELSDSKHKVIKFIFATLDADRNGFINQSELERYFTTKKVNICSVAPNARSFVTTHGADQKVSMDQFVDSLWKHPHHVMTMCDSDFITTCLSDWDLKYQQLEQFVACWRHVPAVNKRSASDLDMSSDDLSTGESAPPVMQSPAPPSTSRKPPRTGRMCHIRSIHKAGSCPELWGTATADTEVSDLDVVVAAVVGSKGDDKGGNSRAGLSRHHSESDIVDFTEATTNVTINLTAAFTYAALATTATPTPTASPAAPATPVVFAARSPAISRRGSHKLDTWVIADALHRGGNHNGNHKGNLNGNHAGNHKGNHTGNGETKHDNIENNISPRSPAELALIDHIAEPAPPTPTTPPRNQVLTSRPQSSSPHPYPYGADSGTRHPADMARIDQLEATVTHLHRTVARLVQELRDQRRASC